MGYLFPSLPCSKCTRIVRLTLRLTFYVTHFRYEPYLLDIKRQSYLHHAVNLKFFVQLNPMYTEYLGFGVATPLLKSRMQVNKILIIFTVIPILVCESREYVLLICLIFWKSSLRPNDLSFA